MKGPDDSAQKDAQKEAKKQAALQQATADALKKKQQGQQAAMLTRGAGVASFLSQGDTGKGILSSVLGV